MSSDVTASLRQQVIDHCKKNDGLLTASEVAKRFETTTAYVRQCIAAAQKAGVKVSLRFVRQKKGPKKGLKKVVKSVKRAPAVPSAPVRPMPSSLVPMSGFQAQVSGAFELFKRCGKDWDVVREAVAASESMHELFSSAAE